MVDRPAFARPDQLLTTHLDGVATTASDLCPDTGKTPAGDPLPEVMRTVGILHDFGKLTSHFQSYLKEETNRPPQPREYHAPVSALVTLQALKARNYDRQTTLAGYYAVAKHHGVIPDIDTDLSAHAKRFAKPSSAYHVTDELFTDIDTQRADQAATLVADATDGALDWETVLDTTSADYQDTFRGLDGTWEPSPQFYQTVLRVWSTLTCADKLDAADDIDIPKEIERPDPDEISFENQAEGLLAELNAKRTQARETAVERAHQLADTGTQVFTLTLPTGFGKTAAGLETALTLSQNADSRVIYALPYTTIIDQLHDVVIDTFGVRADSEAYTIHHHLADTRTTIADERVADGTETLYGETWQAGLVLTTFVQLFESVAGPENVQSIKLPALQDAVIVVDEPQALPKRWWYLVSRLISMLLDEYDATVILMTATQPRIIDEINPTFDPKELVTTDDATTGNQYFDFLDTHERVTFRIHESLHQSLRHEETSAGLPHAETGATIRADMAAGENVLAISNTVRSARQVGEAIDKAVTQDGVRTVALGDQLASFYRTDQTAQRIHNAVTTDSLEGVTADFLASITASDSPPPVLTATLTAALRPCDRAVLIEAMRRILDPEVETPVDDSTLVVSATQLVEAGVDVSFDRIYRDMAPVPSLVQAAGRCNRSFEGGTGEVVIWRLAPLPGQNQSPSAHYTREGDRLRPTRQALQEVVDRSRCVSEYEMLTKANDRYYKYLHAPDHTTEESDSLARAVDEACGETLRSASLIADTTDDAVVLCADADAQRVAEYVEARRERAFGTAQQAFTDLKHFMVSADPDRIERVASTTNTVEELTGASTDELKFEIVDAREVPVYSLADGAGIRDL